MKAFNALNYKDGLYYPACPWPISTMGQKAKEQEIQDVWNKVGLISPDFHTKHPGFKLPDGFFENNSPRIQVDCFQQADLRFAKGCLYLLSIGEQGEPIDFQELRTGLITAPVSKLVQSETKPLESEPIRMDDILAPQAHEIAEAGIPIASERQSPSENKLCPRCGDGPVVIQPTQTPGERTLLACFNCTWTGHLEEVVKAYRPRNENPSDIPKTAIIETLWTAHREIGEWLQVARAKRARYTDPGHEPYCPTLSAIEKGVAISQRIARLATSLAESQIPRKESPPPAADPISLSELRKELQPLAKENEGWTFFLRMYETGDICRYCHEMRSKHDPESLRCPIKGCDLNGPPKSAAVGHILPPGWRWMKTGNIARAGDYQCPEGRDPYRVENAFEIESHHAPVMRKMTTWAAETPSKVVE